MSKALQLLHVKQQTGLLVLLRPCRSPRSHHVPAGVTRSPALDGGWGWVVVACSFLALLLGYGSPQTVGHPEWLLAFGEGKATTARVGSVVTGVRLEVGTFPPQIFVEDVAQNAGLSEGVASISLVCLASVGAGVGKLGLGAMADLLQVNSVFLYVLTVGVAGLGVLLIPLTRPFQTPYITTRLVGVEKLTEAHGILMFFGGVALMLGPPVMGSFYDVTQSYDLAFYLSGSCTMAGGLILFVAAILLQRETPPPPPAPPETALIS